MFSSINKKVVSFGELMLRLKAPGSERYLQSGLFEATFGGAEAAVAVSLANYGMKSEFITAFPKNDISDVCLRQLNYFGVDTQNVRFTDGRLGVYYLEAGSCQRASKVIYDRDYTAAALIKKGDFDWENIFAEAGWFNVSGITAAISKGAAEEALRAVIIAKEMGLTVSVDLNYRAKLWNYGAAPIDIMPEICKYADVIIGGAGDFPKMLGIIPQTPDDAVEVNVDTYKDICKKTLDAYPKLELVAIPIRRSLSGEHNTLSACICDRNEFVLARTFDIANIVDRLGGGDAFTGGLIYGLNAFDTNEKALNFALAASVLKHSIFGDYNRVSVDEVINLVGSDGTVRVAR